ncbi:MAG: hypothetical protein J5758_02115 [Abditibacteriota bacterium]|nr:hypothetical protein [Abditibacteriota bacterium]
MLTFLTSVSADAAAGAAAGAAAAPVIPGVEGMEGMVGMVGIPGVLGMVGILGVLGEPGAAEVFVPVSGVGAPAVGLIRPTEPGSGVASALEPDLPEERNMTTTAITIRTATIAIAMI